MSETEAAFETVRQTLDFLNGKLTTFAGMPGAVDTKRALDALDSLRSTLTESEQRAEKAEALLQIPSELTVNEALDIGFSQCPTCAHTTMVVAGHHRAVCDNAPSWKARLTESEQALQRAEELLSEVHESEVYDDAFHKKVRNYFTSKEREG